MPSLQLVSQLFGACNDCTESAGVTQCNLSCKLSHNVGKRNHYQLQKTCYTVQSSNSKQIACNRCRRYNGALLCAIVASLKKSRDKLERGNVTRCKLPATFLATPLQHKLKRKLHCGTLAMELNSTFCNDCKDFLKPLQVAARDCNV